MGPSGSGQVDADAPARGARQADRAARSGSPAQDVGSLSDRDITMLRREHIGFVFQFFNLLPMLTAEENILLPLSIAGEKPDPAFFEDLLERVGLTDRKDAPAGRALGRAAAARRDRARARLAADASSSPTSRPATSTRRRAARSSKLLQVSAKELGQTMVMVTHDAHAASIADRVLFLADGVIVARARPRAARARSSRR